MKKIIKRYKNNFLEISVYNSFINNDENTLRFKGQSREPQKNVTTTKGQRMEPTGFSWIL